MAEMTIAPVATHGFFVDGRWQQEGDIVEIRSPYDGTLVARVAQGRKEHAEAAIAAAVKAFGTTRRLPAFERQRILRQIVAFMIERKEEFARTLAQEAGKPIRAARTEIERSIFTFTVAAEESTRIHGEYLPLDWQEFTAGRWGIVRRFPLGPIAGISPFNFPLNLVAHKVAPAIAAGCALVLKPATQTPLSAIDLAVLLLDECGLPPGYLNVVTGSGGTVGNAIVEHPDIALITFTGSGTVGWEIREKAGRKKVGLELGNNAPVIIEPDGDWDRAARQISVAGFSHAGQSCISVQRIYVHEEIAERFTATLAKLVGDLVVGDPMDESTDVSALITPDDCERVKSWIDEAVQAGAEVVTGG